jgi:hypothetical protein
MARAADSRDPGPQEPRFAGPAPVPGLLLGHRGNVSVVRDRDLAVERSTRRDRRHSAHAGC